MDSDFLHQLTVKELRALASKRGIPNRSKLKRKTDLIGALHDALQAGELAGAATEPASAGVAPLPSEAPPAASSPSKQSDPAARREGPEPGLPIPDQYGQDRLVLMPQDPHHVFAYWELSGDALAKARQQLGEDGTPFLVLSSGGDRELRSIDLFGGNYYFTVQADCIYQAELALRGSDGRLVAVVASEAIRTPPIQPSSRTDETWMAVDSQFDELLERAGLPGGAAGSSQVISDSLRQRIWRETGVYPVSSGEMVGLPSSGALPSSWSSHDLVRH